MNEPADTASPPPEQRPPEGTIVRVLSIINSKGLHARAAAQFVLTVEKFDAQVTVTSPSHQESVEGDSILDLLMLNAAPGTSITVTAAGVEAAEVMAALEELVAGRFGEGE
jgi:phosphocarrier protein HPr